PPPPSSVAQRNRILAEARRSPDRERDGTATGSRMTLRRALRSAPDGLPHVSTGPIRAVRIDAGWSGQRSRSWCATGTASARASAALSPALIPMLRQKKLGR
ncbi:MAG: helix-turn-helix domain-containing protein, partial [Chloroflexota bacterium]|nr:helix-turn-helix domain-containing protein [Chloroflexota bacterium]